MKKLALVLWALLCVPTISYAQNNPVSICSNTTGSNCISGGSALKHVLSLATNNSQVIVTGGRILYDVAVFNTNAATAYLKLYDKATTPTCQSDTVLQTYPLVQNVPFTIQSLIGRQFNLGIGICIVAGIADNDNTSATTGIVANFAYK